MTRAQEIFARIQSSGIAYIDDLIDRKTSEELFLDYKCVATPTGAKSLLSDDKKNLGKAISGFGNSDRGVVIWGVDCRNVAGIGDVPINYQDEAPGPLKGFSPAWFKSVLEGLTSGTTLPPHQGVQHLELVRPSRQDGVVVTYIPAGFGVPYRSVVDGTNQYYIRSGSDFSAAPHGVLAALFGQRPQPITEIVCTLGPLSNWGKHPVTDHPLWAVLNVEIKNVGRGIAEDVFIIIDVESTPFKCLSDTLGNKWQVEKAVAKGWEGPVMAITNPSSRRLPPGATTTVSFDLLATTPRDLSMSVTVGSPGGPSASRQILIDHASIAEAFAMYSETPLEKRHQAFIREAIFTKLKI